MARAKARGLLFPVEQKLPEGRPGFLPEGPWSLAMVPAGPDGHCVAAEGMGRRAVWRGTWQSLAAVPRPVLPWRAALSSRSRFSSSSDLPSIPSIPFAFQPVGCPPATHSHDSRASVLPSL